MSVLQDFLQPVEESLILSEPGTVGSKIKFYCTEKLEEESIVIIGCPDLRGSTDEREFSNLHLIREQFYPLIWNDWALTVYDLGDIIPGATQEDTHFALEQVVKELLNRQVYPLILGGSMCLNHAIYKVLASKEKPLNYTAVDARIEIDNAEKELSEKNYISQMIMSEPNMLFNFSNIGYQSYFVAQSTLKIFESLDFEGVRLGKITENIKDSELIFRSTDFLGINLDSVESDEGFLSTRSNINGFTNREICALTRYAGLSQQIKVTGIYNFFGDSYNKNTAKLVSQMLWYLIEGKSQQQYYREEEYIKYTVLYEDKEIIFIKDKYIDRWWLAVNIETNSKTPFYLVPCSEADYKEALKGNIPDRYWRVFKRFL